jgi:hypothetical protein
MITGIDAVVSCRFSVRKTSSPSHVRQHQVEDDQLREISRGERDRLPAVERLEGLKPIPLKVEHEQVR